MKIPPVTTEPQTVLPANAADLMECLKEGFRTLQALDQQVCVVYGDYASLAVLRSWPGKPVKLNALWGAKLVEAPDAPDHTFVLAAERSGKHKDAELVVHVTMIFQ